MDLHIKVWFTEFSVNKNVLRKPGFFAKSSNHELK